jgi:putative transposase
LADQVLLKIACLLIRGDEEKNAELLALRHENAVLRRNARRMRYEPGDRAWFTALTRFIPRRRWAEVFPVTPATLLAWNRRLAARKYDTSRRRRPGRPATVRSIARLTVRPGAREPPLQLAAAGVRRSSSDLGFAEVGQLVAGQPGPVQAGGPGQRPGPVHGGPAGLPEQFPHEDLLVSHMRTCSSWMARRAAPPRRTARHKIAARRCVGWLAVIKITS